MSSPPGFAVAWQSREASALSLLPAPEPEAARVAAARRAAERRVAPALVEVLAEQQQLPAATARLETLARGGAAVVVTGQQVGLFGGPLYSVYKAASAIAAARAIEGESGVPTLPLFWLQTEDHDFPEIDHCLTPGGKETLRFSISDGGVSARIAVAHRLLGEDVEARLADLEQALAGLPHAAETMGLLRAAYRPGRSLAAAFAALIAGLFEDQGLLLFDPRQARVAALLSPIWRRAIEGAGPIAAALEERGRALRAAGFAEQVHVRPGSPLVFLHAPAAEGPRYRLDPAGGEGERFLLVGDEERRTVTRAELLALAREQPLRLSTSALLRPIAQDALLPTVAYVGGPGEIAYLAQAMVLHPLFDLAAPLPIHRARFRTSDAASRALLEQLGLVAADTGRPRDELLDRAGARQRDPSLPAPEELRERLAGPFRAQLAALGGRLAKIDPGLARAQARTGATVERALDRFTGRYARVLRDRDQVSAARVDRLLRLMQPDGQPQERVFGLPWFLARFGPRPFVRAVLDATRPFDGSLRELAP